MGWRAAYPSVGDLGLIVPELFQNKRKFKENNHCQAQLNDGQMLYGVNDLFSGQKRSVRSYTISLAGKTEQQSSSGIIVSTGSARRGGLRASLPRVRHRGSNKRR
jgi:hypothetical protein